MIRWIVENCLRHRVIAAAAAAIFLVVGARQSARTPIDVFPEFAPPQVEIQTEAPGLSSVDVERLVTAPLEAALEGTPWIETMRSKSVAGLSSIVLLFDEGANLIHARQLVAERLAVAASQLPDVAHAPEAIPPVSSTSRILEIGLTSRSVDTLEMSMLARWVARPRLLSVPGVANVSIWGERPRQLQILIDPDRLAANGVTLDQVTSAARDGTAIGAGGFIDTPTQRVAIAHSASIRTADDLEQLPLIVPGGQALRIGDVTRVVEGAAPPIGDAVVNGGPGLLLVVDKQPWSNTLDVTRGLQEELDALGPALRGIDVDAHIFRPAGFIEHSLDNLQMAMLIGCALVLAILALFLWSWRTALISVVAIPLSLVAAAVVLSLRGGTINTMVLAGLVIALGEVVDDAIIDVENIVRRLRVARSTGDSRSSLAIVLDASLEVRSAIVYATLIVLMVFLPVYFLPGVAGAFFRPLATSYALAVLASMLVALMVTPPLALLLLSRADLPSHDPPLVRLLKRGYRSVLPRIVGHPWIAVIAIAGLLGLTAVGATSMGEEFLPQFKERDFLMHWVGKPGTSLPEMNRITTQVSRELLSIPGVRHFGATVGRAELGEEVVGSNFAELWISIDPAAPYDETVARVDAVVHGYPGLYRDLFTYLRERMEEVLTGTSAALVVRTFGPDLTVLRAQAEAVARAMHSVPGVEHLAVEPQVLVPELDVRVRPSAAQQFGISSGTVRKIAGVLVQGERVGEIHDGIATVPVVVWGEPSLRHDVEAIRRLPIEVPGGARVPLADLADVEIASTPNVVQREDGLRRIDVSCDVRGRDLGAVARDVEKRIAGVAQPRGYHATLLGEYAARTEAQSQLLWLGGLALFGILLVLYRDFGSARVALLVMATLPFALVGGVAAALLGGGVLSLGSLVGFVTVLGIAARNGIMLVSHYRHLEAEENVPFSRDLVLLGSEERLAPILMTALATSLALLPLAIGGERPGQEIEHPLALVILGGLLTSTLLNLFLLPSLYLRFGHAARE